MPAVDFVDKLRFGVASFRKHWNPLQLTLLDERNINWLCDFDFHAVEFQYRSRDV